MPEKFSGLPTDVVTLGNEDAAFLLGSGGSTKRKVARVAGCHLELMDHGENPDEHALEITGDDAAHSATRRRSSSSTRSLKLRVLSGRTSHGAAGAASSPSYGQSSSSAVL